MSLPAIEAIKLIPQQPQTQVALDDQLRALQLAATRLGLYDAADYLRRSLT